MPVDFTERTERPVAVTLNDKLTDAGTQASD